jgi:hypothetical protein
LLSPVSCALIRTGGGIIKVHILGIVALGAGVALGPVLVCRANSTTVTLPLRATVMKVANKLSGLPPLGRMNGRQRTVRRV